jgi:hypothetical protein
MARTWRWDNIVTKGQSTALIEGVAATPTASVDRGDFDEYFRL